MKPKSIAAAKFKEKCLSILDNLSSEGLTVTKHGKPVAVVYPAKTAPADFIGCLKGPAKITGDVFSTGLKWNAQS